MSEPPGRVLGLDLGKRRVGVAYSDEEQRLAFPKATLAVTGWDAIPGAVARLLEHEPAVEIVVGMPLTLAGERGPQAETVERVVERLRRRVSLPVLTWDERLSTVEAEALQAPGSSGRDLDAGSAAVILQRYLDWKELRRRRT